MRTQKDYEERIKEKEERLKEKYEYELKVKRLEMKLELQEELNKLKIQEVDSINKRLEDIKEDKQFQQKVIASNSANLDGALKVSMSALTFLNTYHNDTPPLKTFEEEFANPYQVYEEEGTVKYINDMYIVDGKSIDKDKYIVDKMILLELNGDTVKFFAWLIESIYRNHKYPHLQAYWAKDTTRYNYTVRERITGDIIRWCPDQDGRIITSKVITPLLRFTEAVLKKELGNLSVLIEKKKKEKDLSSMMSIVKKQEMIASFINKVEKNELQEDIIKKMASAFYLDVSKQLVKVKNK